MIQGRVQTSMRLRTQEFMAAKYRRRASDRRLAASPMLRSYRTLWRNGSGYCRRKRLSPLWRAARQSLLDRQTAIIMLQAGWRRPPGEIGCSVRPAAVLTHFRAHPCFPILLQHRSQTPRPPPPLSRSPRHPAPGVPSPDPNTPAPRAGPGFASRGIVSLGDPAPRVPAFSRALTGVRTSPDAFSARPGPSSRLRVVRAA